MQKMQVFELWGPPISPFLARIQEYTAVEIIL